VGTTETIRNGPPQSQPNPLWVQLIELAVRMSGVPLGVWSLRDAFRIATRIPDSSFWEVLLACFLIPTYVLFGAAIILPWNWARSRGKLRGVLLALIGGGLSVFVFGFYPAFRQVPVHALEEVFGLVLLSMFLFSLIGNVFLCWLDLAELSRDGG